MICELYLFINSSFVIVNLACSIGARSVFILLSELSAALFPDFANLHNPYVQVAEFCRGEVSREGRV